MCPQLGFFESKVKQVRKTLLRRVYWLLPANLCVNIRIQIFKMSAAAVTGICSPVPGVKQRRMATPNQNEECGSYLKGKGETSYCRCLSWCLPSLCCCSRWELKLNAASSWSLLTFEIQGQFKLCALPVRWTHHCTFRPRYIAQQSAFSVYSALSWCVTLSRVWITWMKMHVHSSPIVYVIASPYPI